MVGGGGLAVLWRVSICGRQSGCGGEGLCRRWTEWKAAARRRREALGAAARDGGGMIWGRRRWEGLAAAALGRFGGGGGLVEGIGRGFGGGDAV